MSLDLNLYIDSKSLDVGRIEKKVERIVDLKQVKVGSHNFFRKNFDQMPSKCNIIKGALKGSLPEVNIALYERPKCVNEQGEHGLTAAHIAVLRINYDVLQKIASSPHFDPFITDDFNRRAIDCITHPKMQNYNKLLLHKMYGVFPQMASELKSINLS